MNFLRLVSIRTRLIVSFMCIALIPLVFTGYLSIHKSSAAIKSKMTSYSLELVNQIGNNLSSEVLKFDSIMKEIYISNDVQKGIGQSADVDELKQLERNKRIAGLLSEKMTASPYISNILIAISDGETIGQTQARSQTISEEGAATIKSRLDDSKGQMIMALIKAADGSDQLVSARNIVSLDDGSKLGQVILFINPGLFSEAIRDVSIGEGSSMILLDGQGIVIASNDSESLFGQIFRSDELVGKLKDSELLFDSLIDHRKQLVAAAAITGSDWKIVAAIPYSFLQSESNSIRNAIVWSVAICAVIAVLLAFAITNSLSSPLGKLVRLMKGAKGGNLALRVADSGKDEIADVISNFNDMLGNISVLVRQVNASASNVLHSSEEIATSVKRSHASSLQLGETIQDIAIGSTKQADDISEGVQLLELLSDNITRVEEQNVQVDHIVADTKQLSEEALVSVNTLNEKTKETYAVSSKIIADINDLDQDMNEIQKITKIMFEISAQTNILALNASIEAARAGQAGKGFAVVANEVKRLAQQSIESAKMINDIVNAIKGKTEATVRDANDASAILAQQLEAVRNTEQSFKTIFHSMANVSESLGGVNESLRRVLRSKEDTISTIGNISAIAEETAATTEEVSANIDEQVSESGRLQELAVRLQRLASDLDAEISEFTIEDEVQSRSRR
ncbi:methyl-accepting chemotaxis protein [Cohnella endophytica]|uniref:methyl-accepting chemotaxis protein n=1 Tax=Cohnella endophytica TaxID=2419778 RepID=UPI0013141A84|nr:methyl-accepting chemotaxis protein [Cohnella endophytica]